MTWTNEIEKVSLTNERSWKISGFNYETLNAGNVAGKDTWLTPRHIFEPLGHFDLDPCAAPNPRVWDIASSNYDLTMGQNGLTLPWSGRVFCNPPYGSEAGKFMKKLAQHKNGIGLIFVRTETAAWQDVIWPLAISILFLETRITFLNNRGEKGKQTSGSPSALIAFSEYDSDCLYRCGLKGAFIHCSGVKMI
jgi:hypothetical protein